MGLSINPCCEASVTIKQLTLASEDKCEDHCCTDEKKENSENKNSNCDFCSPFFSCGSCAGFTDNAQVINIQVFSVSFKENYQDYQESFLTDYISNMWQPPKIG